MNSTPLKQHFLSRMPNCWKSLSRLFTSLPTVLLFAAVVVFSAKAASCQDGTASPSPAEVDKGFSPMVDHWEKCSFGGDGAIDFTKNEAGELSIEMLPGEPFTGIRWADKFPKEGYELRFQARRVAGFDFFAAVTFPVGKQHCSFVLGGWGGGMVGISSIDGMDASENATTQYKEFKNGTWYTVRIRVEEMNVRCWIDDVEYATVPRHDHELTIRLEMDPCLPVGIASYMTRSELRKIELRRLGDDEAENASKESAAPAAETTTDTK